MNDSLIATVKANDLGEWTGYVTDYAGQRLTIHEVGPGPDRSTVHVVLAFPADWQRKPLVAELLRTTDVEIYGTRRCEELAVRGTGQGTCDRPVDSRGQCDRAGDHINPVV